MAGTCSMAVMSSVLPEVVVHDVILFPEILLRHLRYSSSGSDVMLSLAST